MIIKHYELKNNLKGKNNYFLFYGLNSGLIEELINKDLKPALSKNIFNYDEQEILSDLGKLHALQAENLKYVLMSPG